MSESRFTPRLLVVILLAIFFGIALYIRVCIPYNQVFSGDWIKFTGVDAYYHMRIIDNLVHDFPHRITFDPYVSYPHGGIWPSMPFFDWLLCGIILLIGLGSPTQHTIDVVGVYFPAILDALTIIPVYFIGKELFNRWAGVLSAGLMVLLSWWTLGSTDHHVAETLFSAIAILFLILAIKSAKQRGLSFNHLKRRDWATLSKPLIYSLLAGLFLGIYILTWVGALLFVFIIFVYFIIQSVIDHLKYEATDYLGILGALSLLVASVISLPLMPGLQLNILYFLSLPILMITPLVLTGISRLIMSKKTKPVYYPLTLIGLALVGVAIFYIINPSLVKLMASKFGDIFTPGGVLLTVIEAQPLLFPMGNFSLSVAWVNFTTGFFLSLISLGILAYFVVKRGKADNTLLVVWSLVILAATLAQRRFAYYFVVNVALLTGYLSWQILELAGIRKLTAVPAGTLQIVKRGKGKLKKAKKAAGLTTTRLKIVLAVIVVFFLVFFPNIKPTIDAAKTAPDDAPSDAWCESLSWLKENTPEPFGSPDFYYARYEPPPPGETYKYPESAYGIMAFWEYGHWIIRIAHRPTNNDPGTLWSSEVARCLIAQDEASATQIVDKLGSRYIIIDRDTVTSIFYAVAEFAGRSPEEFYDVYYLPQKGGLSPMALFYPEYYRSLAARLYYFDGKAVVPKSSVVISYQVKINAEGERYKEITSWQSFPSYEEAEAYVSNHASGNYQVVGTNQFISPVPLDALENYKLIYSSKDCITEPSVGMVPIVKVFEYVKWNAQQGKS